MRELVKKNMKVRSIFLIICSLFCAHLAYAATMTASCPQGDSATHYGYYQGNCYAYYCQGSTISPLGKVDASKCTVESCGTAGTKQTTYKASGCSYDTCEKTCCSNGTWTACGGSCPDPSASCSSSQCWNGSRCENKPSGTQYDGCYFEYTNCTCTSGSGWNCNKTYKKTQKGKFTYWGDVIYRGSKPSSTCAKRAVDYLSPSFLTPEDSVATQVCIKHINGMRGVPDGTQTDSATCTIIGNCTCVTDSGSPHPSATEYYSPSNVYSCQKREVSCWEESCGS